MSSAPQEVITATEAKAVETERRSLLATFAARYGLEANNMMRTLKATVLRPSKDGTEASNEQVAAFLIVANQHELNPFTKEIHGFVDRRGGIVPVVGLDGWAKKINEHPQFDGMTFEQDDEKCTCTMHRKDRKYPTVHTEWLSECKRPTEPWQTHPKRMLNWKALIQTARIAFGFAGIYEPDEAERIVAAELDVTPVKVSPVKLKKIVDGLLDATKNNDPEALQAVWGGISTEEQLFVWEHLRSWERAAIKKLQGTAKSLPPSGDLAPWAIEAIKASGDPEALQTTWKLVQDAFAERDEEVPADLDTFYQDRKAELG